MSENCLELDMVPPLQFHLEANKHSTGHDP